MFMESKACLVVRMFLLVPQGKALLTVSKAGKRTGTQGLPGCFVITNFQIQPIYDILETLNSSNATPPHPPHPITLDRFMPQQTTQALSPPTTNACPFVAGPMITNPSLFVGRKDALRTITTRMTGPQPTSINVVGKKRIGKSSLLYHFFQTWEQRVMHPERYVVIYLSLQDANCRTEDDFYKAVAQELLNRPTVRNNPALTTPLNATSLNRQTFSSAIEAWQTANVLPVLCLDKFEALLDKPQNFSNDFYDNLRSLMNKSALMLVIASTEPVKQYAQKKRLTSDFFNVGHTEMLGLFTEKEVSELVSLQANSTQGTNATLGGYEQRQAREWGENHPYLLQLACLLLWEGRQQGKDIKWVKRRFDEEVRYMPRSWFSDKIAWLLLHWILVQPFVHLKSAIKHSEKSISRITDWLLGFVVVVAMMLGLLYILPWTQIIEWLKGLFG